MRSHFKSICEWTSDITVLFIIPLLCWSFSKAKVSLWPTYCHITAYIQPRSYLFFYTLSTSKTFTMTHVSSNNFKSLFFFCINLGFEKVLWILKQAWFFRVLMSIMHLNFLQYPFEKVCLGDTLAWLWKWQHCWQSADCAPVTSKHEIKHEGGPGGEGGWGERWMGARLVSSEVFLNPFLIWNICGALKWAIERHAIFWSDEWQKVTKWHLMSRQTLTQFVACSSFMSLSLICHRVSAGITISDVSTWHLL